MTQKIRDSLVVGLAALVIFGFALAGILKKPRDYSYSERRLLAQKPEISADALLSGQYMEDFEDYSLDQFPLRDAFRSLKAVCSLYVFGQKDNNGLYVVDGNISKLEYPMKEAMIAHAGDVFRNIYDTCLADTDCRVYLSVIPDKNAFLAPAGGYLSMDYEDFAEQMRGRMPYASYIDLYPELSLENYYRTDQHWRQETLLPVAETLLEGMESVETATDEISESWQSVYTLQQLPAPFYGAYYGQAALPAEPDTLYYLTDEVLEDCTVISYHTGRPTPGSLYDMDKAEGKDPYEMFLMGTNPLVVIENPHASTDRELVIFRDSFASSLAPLMVPSYAKITLVDLRYMASGTVEEMISFDRQDVLFLYSTLILNSSSSLR